MVCDRCIMVVNAIFKEVGIEAKETHLGEVLVATLPTAGQFQQLNRLLGENGFERIDDKKSLVLGQLRTLVIERIHKEDHFSLIVNWSDYLSEKLGYDYSYLSSLYSAVTGTTLEQFIILQKIEKVKEYLFYDELSVKEIAFRLGYSSVAHLSSQFKKMTGQTPTGFKSSRIAGSRLSLDKIN